MYNNLRNSILALSLALGVSSLSHASDTDLKAAITELNMQWNNALNSGNAKNLAVLYAEDATLSPGNGKVLVGRAAIEQLFQSFIENGVHNHSLEIVQVSGDEHSITQVAKWSANGPEKDGKKPAFGGITMNILFKDGQGKWKTRVHIWNVAN